MNATDRSDRDGADNQSGELAQPTGMDQTNQMDQMDETDEMDKERLLTRMKMGYERFEAALADLSGEQWLAVSSADGAWSPRDLVAHLTTALELLMLQIEAVAAGHAPLINMINLSHAEVEDATVEAFEARRKNTPQQTLGELRRTYGRLRDAVEVTSWDDLAAVGRFEWLDGVPLWRLIARGTWKHFDKHLPEIERASTMPAD